ncbi:hypothetical protein ElyMa_001284500 [Elysia marginata]|uniref:Uncharacterized protein n=1 Tax=Elysia marginata TaxID=1093978 RepID=A0AAV4IKC4_9GAST|nr:hypothetical protein ElyMa_001284500 [Elysia marginata]
MATWTKCAALAVICLAMVSSATSSGFDFDNPDRLKELIPLGCEAFDTMHTLLGECSIHCRLHTILIVAGRGSFNLLQLEAFIGFWLYFFGRDSRTTMF